MRGVARGDRGLEQLRLIGGVEALQPLQLFARLAQAPELHVRLAQVLARRDVVGLEPQAVRVGVERLGVVAELARRIADQVPGLVVAGVRPHRLARARQRPLELLLRVPGLPGLEVLPRPGDVVVGAAVELLRLLARAERRLRNLRARRVGIAARRAAHRGRGGQGDRDQQDGGKKGRYEAMTHGVPLGLKVLVVATIVSHPAASRQRVSATSPQALHVHWKPGARGSASEPVMMRMLPATPASRLPSSLLIPLAMVLAASATLLHWEMVDVRYHALQV